MLAGLFLAALASPSAADHAACRSAGQVIHAGDGKALICAGDRFAPGQVLSVKRLTAAPGAPGRHPHFVWRETGRVRIDRIDGRIAEATVVRGPIASGHRVGLD